MEVKGLLAASNPAPGAVRDPAEAWREPEGPERQPDPERNHRRFGTSAHFVRSVATLGVAQLLTWLGGAAFTIVGPRALGDAGLGKVSFALALTSLTGLVATFGTGTYVAKEVARAPARARDLVGDALALRLLLSLPAVALTISIVLVGPYDRVTRIAVVVMSGMLVLGAFEVCISALQGLHRMRRLAISTTVIRLVSVGTAVAVLLAGYGPIGFAVAWVVGEATGVAVSAGLLLPIVRPRFRLAPTAWTALLVAGLPFFVWQAALVIYAQIDMVLLSFLSPSEVVGWYSAAYRVVMMPSFLPGILITIIFPAMAATGSTPAVFDAIARRSAHILLMVSIPIGLVLMLLPQQLIAFLQFPKQFDHSTLPIMLLAAHVPLIAIDMVIGTALNALDRQRQWAITAVAAAVFNVLLNLLAIPATQRWYGNGAIGAAAITTLTEMLILAVGLWLLPRPIFGPRLIGDVFRFLVAAAAMALVTCLLRGSFVLVSIGAGFAVYLVACLVFRAVTVAELKEVLAEVRLRRSPVSAA